MKTVTKEFWVPIYFIETVNDMILKKSDYVFFRLPTCSERVSSGDGYMKISMSYEIPEKKIEITESEWDKIVEDVSFTSENRHQFAYIYQLREKLFGDKK